jgi:RNA polymerase subunit RPABC4/transcription elongation factor Spt4
LRGLAKNKIFVGTKHIIRRFQMTIRNQSSTRLKDEIRIIAPWAFYVFTLVFVAVAVFFVIVVGRDRHAPPVVARWLLGILAGTVMGCYAVLIGYINQDAGRRSMSRLLWTLIAIFVPNGLGIVLYFVMRKPRTIHCPQCDAPVEPGFSFCPRCRARLQPVCPQCQRGVDLGDKFCPYCGGTLQSGVGASSAATTSQP